MKIPDELKVVLKNPAKSGEDVISSSRAIMFYLGDELCGPDADFIVPFQSIDSQTDHIKLVDDLPFPLPSTRVSLGGRSDGHLISSSVDEIMLPGDPKYSIELNDIFNVFGNSYNSAVSELLTKCAAN